MRTLGLILPYRSIQDARRALRVLSYANDQYGPPPPLYTSGVRYRTEPPGREERWLSWPVLLSEGEGDCEDLASYLASETGGRAVLYRSGPHLLHVITQLPTGEFADPSRILGMR